MNASTTYTHFLIASLKRFRPVPALLAVLLLCGAAAFAQLDTGSISGVVTDPAGRIVQGAAITATSAATGTTYSTVSSNTGYYVMPSVRTGTYVVKITSTGFKTAVYNNVTVSIGASTSRDVTLAVGAVDENVTVTAGTVSLEKDTSEIDATITPVQEAELPLQVTGSLRSITSLEFLVPGTVGPGTSSGGSGFQMTKINGGQEEGTDYLVDGITTNRQENGSGSVDILTPSARRDQRISYQSLGSAGGTGPDDGRHRQLQHQGRHQRAITERSSTSTRTPHSTATTGSTTAISRRPPTPRRAPSCSARRTPRTTTA